MRVATVDGRVAVRTSRGFIDIERASEGRFGSGSLDLYERWEEFLAWATATDLSGATPSSSAAGPPSPTPRQVFAIGLNYADHAAESGLATSSTPPTFTKFPTCITGPEGDLVLPGSTVDWEAELVVVMARRAHCINATEAWSYVAGLTVGQDYSERTVQLTGASPQYSLGKSFPGFGPTGPELVTIDELDNPDDLSIECTINGEVVQSARTSQMICGVPELVAHLSSICTLLPGDLIFTGTPAGVGAGRDPKRFLVPGDVVETTIGGLGTLRQRCVAQP